MPSQRGPVHLFDLCLWFGHIVKGCTLEDHHLGALPDARRYHGFSVAGYIHFDCRCEGWQTCSSCCWGRWGFPVGNGIWMKDWDASLLFAENAARKAAKTLLIAGILDISRRNEPLPFAMSEAAAARLLDIAILCGDVEAATNLAKTYRARPLRRWRGNELHISAAFRTISAALFAGADFEGLHETLMGEAVPLLRRIALDFEPEQLQLLEQFFPAEKNQWPTCDMDLGKIFLEEDFNGDACVSMQRIQNAFKAGWDLKRIWTRLCLVGDDYDQDASLLDLAVLCGQPDCAVALGSAGVELKAACLDLHRWAFCTDTDGPRDVVWSLDLTL